MSLVMTRSVVRLREEAHVFFLIFGASGFQVLGGMRAGIFTGCVFTPYLKYCPRHYVQAITRLGALHQLYVL
jgi:hypothetical protein